jgi:hypothetical protein
MWIMMRSAELKKCQVLTVIDMDCTAIQDAEQLISYPPIQPAPDEEAVSSVTQPTCRSHSVSASGERCGRLTRCVESPFQSRRFIDKSISIGLTEE